MSSPFSIVDAPDPHPPKASFRLMFSSLSKFVSRRWPLVILFWVLLAVGIRVAAPRWDDVTHDGDFAYLPDHVPSVVGARLLKDAFPDQRAKSEIVVLTVREDNPLTADDIFVANDLARRLRNVEGVAQLEQADLYIAQAKATEDSALSRELLGQADKSLRQAVEVLEEAVRLDDQLMNYRLEQESSDDYKRQPAVTPRLAAAHHNLSLAYERLGAKEKAAESRQQALAWDPTLKEAADRTMPPDAANWPLLEVWTWHHEIVGDKLRSKDKHARLILLKLSQEFMATDNIRVLEKLETILDEVRDGMHSHTQDGLQIGMSGSAAVGGDMLQAARDSIRHTEMFTILLVVVILAVVYRSPLLVAVPLVTIFVSFIVATGIVALLTQIHVLPGFDGWSMRIFTTTKIFIVVILFGAGTDFCLFLISRYKEELDDGLQPRPATARALFAVSDALVASAMTTILGLSMMFFADFGKFSSSGPVIGLCLGVTLIACMTLAPALLCAFGNAVFWPFGLRTERNSATTSSSPGARRRSWSLRAWQRLARLIVTRPGAILGTCVLILLPMAGYGWLAQGHISYDFLSGLSPDRPSRVGAEMLRRHFPVGESGPVTVVVHQDGLDLKSDAGREEIATLTQQLYLPPVAQLRQLQQNHAALQAPLDDVLLDLEPRTAFPKLVKLGREHPQVAELLTVSSVRSASDPKGAYWPGRRLGGVSAIRTRMMRAHQQMQRIFVGGVEDQANVARFEVVLRHDPFSIEAIDALSRMDDQLRAVTSEQTSPWHGATVAYSGTTAAIRDLRQVTQSDQTRIQILVVVAVLGVLLVILRRPVVCVYMILSVLLSYFVAIGVTDLFFTLVYGELYQGLDWKVPVFLFVILVAIGQDYNVYLATRVFEEQATYGPFAGLRRAVVRTGGIITSCGVIMAGTFASMTSATWHHVIPFWSPASGEGGGSLLSIIELGFALSLGVMLDTFVVRPVLVPAFLAFLCRWQSSGWLRDVAKYSVVPLRQPRTSAAESNPLT